MDMLTDDKTTDSIVTGQIQSPKQKRIARERGSGKTTLVSQTDRNIQEIIDYHKLPFEENESEEIDLDKLSFIGRIKRTKTAEFANDLTHDVESILNHIRSQTKKQDILIKDNEIVETQKLNKNGLLDFLVSLDDFLFNNKEDFESGLEMNEEELDFIYKLKNKVSSLSTQKKQYQRKVKELNNINLINRFRFKKSMYGIKNQVDSMDRLHSPKLLIQNKKNCKTSNSISELIALADKQIELYEKYSN